MAQFVNIYKCDLHKGPVVTSLHQVFLGDVEANRVGVHVTDNGEDVTLSGTCSGTAILCNGGTVALTGTVDGSLAYVDLPSAVYTVEGPVEIYVTLTQGDQTTTLLTAHGNAVRTDSGVVIDPGTIIPSVAALISDIDDAVASIPADYSDLLGTIAPDFSSSTAYTAGQYVWYSGTLYRFTSDHAAGSWTGTDAISAEIGEDVADLKGAITHTDDVILGNSTDLNLYIKGTNVYGKYWTYTGKEATGQNVCVTDYIPVNEGVTYTYSGLTNVGSAPHSLFFDSSKTYLSGFKQKVGSNNTITAPTGAKYVSFSILGSDDATFEFMSPIALATKTEVEAVDDAWRESFQTGIIYKNIAFEQGGFSNTNENTESNTRIRSVNLIDFSEYRKVTIEIDEGYKIIRLDYDGTPPYDMTQWVSQSYTFGVAENMLYRFGFAKTDDSNITPTDASHVRFKVAEIDSPSLEELKTTAYQVRDTRPTYVILDFDADISSLSDNRVTLVHDTYGYNFTFVGISSPETTKALIEKGCDLSIYSNSAGYLPNTSTINSEDPADIAAWDAYVAEVLGRYNAAGFYNQVCWSCQGMNYGSALETALKKYGFKMARGNQVGETNSIYIDGFDDDSFRVGCYQIYSDHPELALQQVTNAVNNDKDICIFTHNLVETLVNNYDCTISAYTTLLEGIKAKEAAGQVKVVTFREYYKMHCWKSNYEYDYNRIFKTIWHETN